MKQSIPVPIAIAVILIVAVLVAAVLWPRSPSPTAASTGSAVSAGASQPTSQAPPADMQKNPAPQDLAKQYGYTSPPGR